MQRFVKKQFLSNVKQVSEKRPFAFCCVVQCDPVVIIQLETVMSGYRCDDI